MIEGCSLTTRLYRQRFISFMILLGESLLCHQLLVSGDTPDKKLAIMLCKSDEIRRKSFKEWLTLTFDVIPFNKFLERSYCPNSCNTILQ